MEGKSNFNPAKATPNPSVESSATAAAATHKKAKKVAKKLRQKENRLQLQQLPEAKPANEKAVVARQELVNDNDADRADPQTVNAKSELHEMENKSNFNPETPSEPPSMESKTTDTVAVAEKKAKRAAKKLRHKENRRQLQLAQSVEDEAVKVEKVKSAAVNVKAEVVLISAAGVSPDGPDPNTNQHPLLKEDVLDNIFSYFTDPQNLGSFRLVCPIWNTSASRTVKKNLRWKIGPTLHSERRFMEVMSNCKDDIFGNFLWTHDPPPGVTPRTSLNAGERSPLPKTWHKHVEEFLQMFGERIMNLRLCARDPGFVQRRLQTLYLPNLEYLELYHISTYTMEIEMLDLNQIYCFPKLKSLCLTPRFSTCWNKGTNRNCLADFREAKGAICNKLMKATPKLEKIEIDVPQMKRRLLKEKHRLALARLANITSFKITPPADKKGFPALVTLNGIELQNLLKSCPQLKILYLTISSRVTQHEIYEILGKFPEVCNQLEELQLAIRSTATVDPFGESMESESLSDSSSEDTDSNNGGNTKRATLQKICHPLPEMLKLKKLELQYWRLLDFDVFYNKPDLAHVDLFLSDSSCLFKPSVNVLGQNMNVKFLKWRDSERRCLPGVGIERFATLFPNLEEFDVKIGTDEDLEPVFKYMSQLKRLNLSDGPVSDLGITGMSDSKLQEAAEKSLTLEQVSTAGWRDKFYIGDLKGLQHFTSTGLCVTGLSIQYGVAALKNLTNLKLMTDLRENRKWTPDYSKLVETTEDIRPLVANCKNLVKLDFNVIYSDDRYFRYDVCQFIEDDSDLMASRREKEPEVPNCGLNSEEIKLLKEAFPHLNLVLW